MLKVIVVLLAMVAPQSILASECINIDGVEYCKQEQTTVKFGDVTLNITDPKKLFDKIEEKQITKFTKVSLWNHYDYPPFIKELAAQNNMDTQQLINILAEKDQYWAALKELEGIYEDIFRHYDKQIIEAAMDVVIKQIITDITNKIEKGVAHG